MSTTIPIGGASAASLTSGMTTAGMTLGVGDGTGPLLQHVTAASGTTMPLAGAAVVAATIGGVALFGLLAAAAAGVGYLGYRIFNADLGPDGEEPA